MVFPAVPTGRRIGFWIADDDVYSGDPVFGNVRGVAPTPQQFFNAYFLTSPFPASMIWTGGLQSSASLAVPPDQEAQWFNQLLTIADGYPNIAIWAIFFLNLSGNSIIGTTQAPNPATGLSNVGFTVNRVSPLTKFTIASAAGLAPSHAYTLNLLDSNMNLIAKITDFATDATGAWTGTVPVPNTTDAQSAAGGFIVVQGTKVGCFAGWQNDQTTNFTNYVNTIKGHRSFVGALFEPEYFGDTPAIQATFNSIVQGAGYYVLGGTNDPTNGFLTMYYSSYPYFNGALRTGAGAPGELGVHYGETGAPIAPDPVPIWTQSTVKNIVENSEVFPITIIISVNDQNNPAAVAPAFQSADGTDWYMYMSPVLRGWIASDPAYANYLLANAGGSPPPTPTTLTLVAKQV